MTNTNNVVNIDALAIANAAPGMTPRQDFDLATSLAERGTEFKGASTQVAALGVIRFWDDAHNAVKLAIDKDDKPETFTLSDLAGYMGEPRDFGNMVRAVRLLIMRAAYGQRPKQRKGKAKITAHDLRISQKTYDDKGKVIAAGVKLACIVVVTRKVAAADVTNAATSPKALLALYDKARGFPFHRADYMPRGAVTATPDAIVFANNGAPLGLLVDDKPDVVRPTIDALFSNWLPKTENAGGDEDADARDAIETLLAFVKDKTGQNVVAETMDAIGKLREAIAAFYARTTAAGVKPGKKTA